MENDLGIKLIAVISSVEMILYEAKGIKIIRELEELPIVFVQIIFIHLMQKL